MHYKVGDRIKLKSFDEIWVLECIHGGHENEDYEAALLNGEIDDFEPYCGKWHTITKITDKYRRGGKFYIEADKGDSSWFCDEVDEMAMKLEIL